MVKTSIEVRKKGEGFRNPGKLIETIKRKIWSEAIGNFNPIFCHYKGKRTLIQSMKGDVSDPFRRDESYLETLYIEVE